jgi:prevent-host-death family protein
MTKTVEAITFQAECVQLLNEVADNGMSLVITKNGTPVAQLVPVPRKPRTLYGALKGSLTIHGDIISPLDAEWEAVR